MAVSAEEQRLLARLTEPEDDRDEDDMIVESWMKRLARGYVVRFEDMLEEDVRAREVPSLPCPQTGGNDIGANASAEMTVQLSEILEVLNCFREEVGESMKKIESRFGDVELRLSVAEAYIHEQITLAKKSHVHEELNPAEERPPKRSKKN